MPTASYYRMKAKECFDQALSANLSGDAAKWQQRGREYTEMAVAMDAESGKGPDPPYKLASEE